MTRRVLRGFQALPDDRPSSAAPADARAGDEADLAGPPRPKPGDAPLARRPVPRRRLPLRRRLAHPRRDQSGRDRLRQQHSHVVCRGGRLDAVPAEHVAALGRRRVRRRRRRSHEPRRCDLQRRALPPAAGIQRTCGADLGVQPARELRQQVLSIAAACRPTTASPPAAPRGSLAGRARRRALRSDRVRSPCVGARALAAHGSSCTRGTGSRSCFRRVPRRARPSGSSAATAPGCSRVSPSGRHRRRRSPTARRSPGAEDSSCCACGPGRGAPVCATASCASQSPTRRPRLPLRAPSSVWQGRGAAAA